jgi:pimeloyl-ACP methyl ester carboxylesterase
MLSRSDPPPLIIRCAAGTLGPLDQSERLHQALKKAGAGGLFSKVEGAGHGAFRNPDGAYRFRQFLDNHVWTTLGGDSPRAGACVREGTRKPMNLGT